MPLIRLDKFLTECGCGTRSEAKKLLKSQKIKVNDRIEKDGSVKVNTDRDVVCLGDRVLTYRQYHYVMLSKPAGCVTANKDNLHKTVMDLLPEELRKNMSPVGRLDLDTEGLLLITDHGELAHRLLSPAHHVPKTYYAKIRGSVKEEHVQLFLDGMDIGEEKRLKPAVLEILSSDEDHAEIKVTITEGKFHQVKRMFLHIGTEVTYLKRISMGSLVLDDSLKPGEWRYLTKEEEEYLLSC